MISKISKYTYKQTTRLNIWIVFSLFLLLNLLVFPFFIGEIGHDKKILDLSFGFSADEAYATIKSYGESGRQVYRLMLLTADLIYPFVYSILLMMGLSVTFNKNLQSDTKWLKLNIVPLLAGLFDLCENSGILYLLYQYPNRIDFLAKIASLSGIMKFSIIGISLSVIFIGIIFQLVKRMKNKNVQ